MNATSFQCPHCATPLRVRDRKYVGRRIGCPECRQPIEIVADGPRGLAARSAAAEQAPASPGWRERVRKVWPVSRRRSADGAPAGAPAAIEASDAAPRREPGRMARAAAVFASPIGVAWTLAGVITLGLVVLIWPSDGSPTGARRSRDARQTGTNAGNGTARQPGDVDEPRGAAADPDRRANLDRELTDRLTQLGERLEAYRETHGHFPRGTVPQPQLPPRDRFSWLASVYADLRRPGQPEPLWNERWHDPLNDRFARWANPELLNPAIGERVGPNRFPATHFVGVAGVGPDAPELPANHPRAGIFGYERQTRLDDIHDGAANTMLLGGVRERLGGWAGGGPGSVRPLTREPYVNGPDGFGTGQRDSMLVLMADGSVRTVSKDTAPVIVRRMAAMADGLPLDENVPGEPGDAPAADPDSPDRRERADLAANAADPPPAADEPGPPADAPAAELEAAVDPPVAAPVPAEPAIDFAAALAQNIQLYDVPRAVPARRLLLEVEEMLGAPLELDGGETNELEDRLDRAIALRLEQTTVGGILDEVTRQAGLSYTIGSGMIRLRVAADAADGQGETR